MDPLKLEHALMGFFSGRRTEDATVHDDASVVRVIRSRFVRICRLAPLRARCSPADSTARRRARSAR